MSSSFGRTIREQREALGFSRGDLAKKLGVQSSHLSYIENDQRRPSLGLLKRMARALELSPRQLFLLCHPEAREFCAEHGEEKRNSETHTDPWREFFSNRVLLKRYKVTAPELKLLRQISLYSAVSHRRDCLFILSALRAIAEPYAY